MWHLSFKYWTQNCLFIGGFQIFWFPDFWCPQFGSSRYRALASDVENFKNEVEYCHFQALDKYFLWNPVKESTGCWKPTRPRSWTHCIFREFLLGAVWWTWRNWRNFAAFNLVRESWRSFETWSCGYYGRTLQMGVLQMKFFGNFSEREKGHRELKF